MFEFTTAAFGLVVLISFVQEAETSAWIVLSAYPQTSNVMAGETVHITCKVEDSDRSIQWEYTWKKQSEAKETILYSDTGEGFSAYTLSRVTESNSAQYWCEAKTKNRKIISSPHTLTVTSPPPAVLTLNPAWTKFYPTEKVTLKCEIQSLQTEWSYLWYRDGAAINSVDSSSGNEHTIPALNQSHSGRYSCQGGIPGRGVYTEMSNNVTLTVDGEAPKPLLTLDPPSGEIFTGDTVTLSCRAGTDPAGWEYLWFKETLGAALSSTDSNSTDGSSYTIHSAAVSHGGEYWCRAGRGRLAFYTPYSDSLQLSITARPQAVLTLETAWTEIFRSDSLTLRCQVKGSSAEWNYTWYRDGQHLPLDPRGDRLTLSSGNDSYSSEYKCRGNQTGQPSYTEISEGFRANNIVENLARVAVGAAILLFLSVIVNEGFWRRARKMRRCCI